MPNEEKANTQFSGGTPKPNHSNDGELQPTKPDGTFTYKNGATTLDEMVRKEEGVKASIKPSNNMAGFNWKNNPALLEKMKSYAQKMLSEKQTSPNKEQERFSIDYSKENIAEMTPEEASKKCQEVMQGLKNNPSNPFTFAPSASNFTDPRMKLAFLRSLEKVVADFPMLKSVMGQIQCRTGSNQYWGNTKPKWVKKYDEKNGAFGFALAGGNWLAITATSNPNKSAWYKSINKGPAAVTIWDFKKMADSSAKNGFHDYFKTADEAAYSVPMHELGHNIHYMIMKQVSEKEGKLFVGNKEYLSYLGIPSENFFSDNEIVYEVNKRIIDKAKEMFPDAGNYELKNDCSDYAKTNPKEWFAETFASMYSSTPRMVAQAMREVFKEMFKQ